MMDRTVNNKNHAITTNPALKEWKKNYDLYLLLIPAVVFFILFAYVPMGGLIIAFKDYNIFKGIWASDWSGLMNFREMFSIPEFWRMTRNTLVLNLLGLLVCFPAPIILALMLNEVRSKWLKKISQSLLYLPHFMSWIVLGGIVYALMSPKYGIINEMMRWVGLDEIYFMADTTWWITTYTLTAVWQSAGWGTIIYLAAITSIDPSLYEAASIDGAGRLRKIVSVTIPSILPTIIILFILAVGNMVSIGIEQPLALANPAVGDVSEVISTYVYRVGIKQGDFGLTTAVGMVQSIINLVLIVLANRFARKAGGEGLW
jgi:putative aldouronate transport system permease protein